MSNLRTMLTLLSSCVLINLCLGDSFSVNLQWSNIDYRWPTNADRESAIKNGSYIVQNVYINSLRPWKHRLFLTSPRIKQGVPVTLSVVSKTGVNSPYLEPYPNWEMQRINDCSAFQSVKAIEIDTRDGLWVADSGNYICPPKIVIIDLNHNRIVKSFNFASNVANIGTASFNNIVVDGDYAYITDSDDSKPGIVVYNSKDLGDAWKKIDGRDNSSMRAEKEFSNFLVDLTTVNNTRQHINAIALSPASAAEGFVYYSAFSSYHMYALPTRALQSKSSNEDLRNDVILVGPIPSPIESMTMSNYGLLYFGLITESAVSFWDTNLAPLSIGQRIIFKDNSIVQWPSSFAFDDSGNLWCLSNRKQNFLSGKANINEINFRALSLQVNMKSSQYPIPQMDNNNVQTDKPISGRQGTTKTGKSSSSEQSVVTLAHVLLAWILVFCMK